MKDNPELSEITCERLNREYNNLLVETLVKCDFESATTIPTVIGSTLQAIGSGSAGHLNILDDDIV